MPKIKATPYIFHEEDFQVPAKIQCETLRDGTRVFYRIKQDEKGPYREFTKVLPPLLRA